tara:strand:- start:181 stop:582 length:402 start_codon:yes stop_codon:yes gene_type:complete
MKRAASWKAYYLSMLGAFVYVFFLALPALAILNGFTLRESLAFPLTAVWLGFPLLLIAFTVTYPLFRFLYAKSTLAYGARVFVSGGITATAFVLLGAVLFSTWGGLYWYMMFVSYYALGTGLIAIFFYWLCTK